MPIEILMPALSPTMTEGTLAKWLKKEGDNVSSGDVLCEIETDKATMEVEAVDEGIMGKIVVGDANDNVPVNKVIALLLEEGEDKSVLDSYKIKDESIAVAAVEDSPVVTDNTASVAPAAAPTLAPKTLKAPASPVVLLSKNSDKIKVSPLAKRLAEQYNINLSSVKGSGPKGRIVKADVEDAIAGGGTSGSVCRDAVEFVQVPNNNMRKTVARRLTESKQQVPHFYLSIDCELDKLLDVRKQINDNAPINENEKPAYKVSVNDFIIKAVGLALRDVPEANATWYDDAIVLYNNVDVSVAVAIDGGLITPIVRNSDQKSLPQISTEMKDLAGRARKNALQPEEYQGGGFSISNLGMFGVKTFSAIINPPQSCILAVGAGEERAVVKNGKLEIATIMTVTLSTDHRSVDGAVGAVFMQAFKKYIESPVLMMV